MTPIEKLQAALRKKAAQHARTVAHRTLDLTSPVRVRDESGLLPWQPEAAGRLARTLSALGAALDASSTGTGKTVQALATMRELGLSPVVVCPKAVRPSWRHWAKHVGVELADVVNYESVRIGRHPLFDGTRWARGTPALVFDEAHRARNEDTLNGSLIVAARRQNIPTLMVSATVAETPVHLKSIGFALGLHDGENFPSWAANYGCDYGDGGLSFVGDESDLAKLSAAIFPARGWRVRIADLGDAFPETQIVTEPYEADNTPAIVAAYDEMFAELEALEAKAARDAFSNFELVTVLRGQQKVELLKVPLLASLAEDAVAEGRSVAIFVNFTETLTALCARLKTRCSIHGGQTGPRGEVERQACIDDFQADRARIIVVNTKAGGVGVSLHDIRGQYPRTALIAPTFSAVDLKQALGRVHRAGGKSKSQQRVVFVAGTIEERAAASVMRKMRHMEVINGGVQ